MGNSKASMIGVLNVFNSGYFEFAQFQDFNESKT